MTDRERITELQAIVGRHLSAVKTDKLRGLHRLLLAASRSGRENGVAAPYREAFDELRKMPEGVQVLIVQIVTTRLAEEIVRRRELEGSNP